MNDIKWLTTNDLSDVIAKYANKPTRDAFLGVLSIDHLPSHVTGLPAIFIMNTNSNNLPGQHWKAIFIGADGNGEIFDSLATPISLRLQHWMNRYAKTWITSKLVLQNPIAPTCGAYVVYYVLNRLHCDSLSVCLSAFSANVMQNDEMMLRYFKSLSHK